MKSLYNPQSTIAFLSLQFLFEIHWVVRCSACIWFRSYFVFCSGIGFVDKLNLVHVISFQFVYNFVFFLLLLFHLLSHNDFTFSKAQCLPFCHSQSHIVWHRFQYRVWISHFEQLYGEQGAEFRIQSAEYSIGFLTLCVCVCVCVNETNKRGNKITENKKKCQSFSNTKPTNNIQPILLLRTYEIAKLWIFWSVCWKYSPFFFSIVFHSHSKYVEWRHQNERRWFELKNKGGWLDARRQKGFAP